MSSAEFARTQLLMAGHYARCPPPYVQRHGHDGRILPRSAEAVHQHKLNDERLDAFNRRSAAFLRFALFAFPPGGSPPPRESDVSIRPGEDGVELTVKQLASMGYNTIAGQEPDTSPTTRVLASSRSLRRERDGGKTARAASRNRAQVTKINAALDVERTTAPSEKDPLLQGPADTQRRPSVTRSISSARAAPAPITSLRRLSRRSEFKRRIGRVTPE